MNHESRAGMFLKGLAVLALATASCASTEMTSTWTDPSAKGASLSKVAVVCLTKDPGNDYGPVWSPVAIICRAIGGMNSDSRKPCATPRPSLT